MTAQRSFTFPERAFDGDTYKADRDYDRLTSQIWRVSSTMKDGRWHTIAQLATISGGSEAAVSARIRDLRKPKYGSRTIERRYVKNGLYEYRLVSGEV